jgi:hypothetical protein
MGLHYKAAEVQAQAATHPQIMSVLLPKEHFKQRGQILGVDPGPFIFDPYQQYLIAELSQSDRHRPFTSGSDRNGNDALRRRIFERVV